jgi:hypothetical protein
LGIKGALLTRRFSFAEKEDAAPFADVGHEVKDNI